jgi:hypothetical protein
LLVRLADEVLGNGDDLSGRAIGTVRSSKAGRFTSATVDSHMAATRSRSRSGSMPRSSRWGRCAADLAVKGWRWRGAGALRLPFRPFNRSRTARSTWELRAWVEEQTALKRHVGSSTFGDRGRHALPGDAGAHIVSVAIWR